MGISGHIESEPIFIHFEFDGYRPHLMESEKSGQQDGMVMKKGFFVKKMMCPPRTRI